MRKFISLMSAAAMVAALVPSVAMAEDTVLYSNSFNGYETSSKTDDGSVFAVAAGTAAHEAAGIFQWLFNSPQSRKLDKLTVDATGSDDDTASIMINEKDAADKYISMPKNRFPARCTPKIIGFENYTANDGESLVISFKAMLTEGDQGAATLDLGDVGTITSDTLGTGEWKDVKLVVANGATTKYVDGTQVGEPVSAVPSVIKPVPFDASTKCTTYATVCIDDLVILSSADGVDAVIPAAEDQTLEEDEPVETTAPEAAPAFAAHATATKLMSQTFNAADTGSIISIGTEAQDPNTSIPGLEFRVGNRGSGADTSSYASVSKLADDNNVVKIAGGKFASNGRGVRMALADNLSIADDTSLTSIMAFAFKVEPAQNGGKGQLYLLDNDTNVDGNGVARDILAVFTSADDAANYSNGNTQIGINVTPGEWHIARIAVSNGSYRVYLDDNTDDPAVKAEKVNSGDTSKAVTNLPILAATNAKSGSENYSLVTVDNIMAYQISASFEKKYLPGVAETQNDVVPEDTPATTAPTAGPAKPGTAVAAVAKAATKVENEELRISDGTNGAVFRFDVSDFTAIESVRLIVKAAPRSYKADNTRWENTEVWTYKVGSTWNSESTEITNDAWNKLSKNDPINKQWTKVYTDATGEAVAPYQTLEAIDVTDMIGEDGVAIFAFKTSTTREHAIDAVLEVVGTQTNDINVQAVAKASTKTDGDEFRISDGTNGAVYKFDINDQAPAGEKIVSVQLYVSAAPRSYKADSSRFESTSIMTYKVGSTWSGEGTEITNDDWNKLSKGDPIDTQNTANYPTGDPAEKAPYQTLKPIDVTDMFTDGVATFAFKTGSAREHAIDAYVVVTTAKNVWTKFAATKDANGVLTNVTMTAVDDPAAVELGANEYLWNQFQTPYVTAE